MWRAGPGIRRAWCRVDSGSEAGAAWEDGGQGLTVEGVGWSSLKPPTTRAEPPDALLHRQRKLRPRGETLGLGSHSGSAAALRSMAE